MAREQQPIAITLDVMMPGVDGWSVLTALKSDPKTAAIPVIVVTMLEDRQLGFALGAADFLTKPVDQERLRQTLSACCGVPVTRALVVEDDEANRQLLCRMLEKDGIRVQQATNGKVALDQLAGELPDIILLDLTMPVVDGFEFIRIVRQDARTANVPIVVITAKDLTDEDRQRLAASVEQVISKSAWDQERLLAEITAVLAKRTD
jgi:CheY-like chemotaxis protein